MTVSARHPAARAAATRGLDDGDWERATRRLGRRQGGSTASARQPAAQPRPGRRATGRLQGWPSRRVAASRSKRRVAPSRESLYNSLHIKSCCNLVVKEAICFQC